MQQRVNLEQLKALTDDRKFFLINLQICRRTSSCHHSTQPPMSNSVLPPASSHTPETHLCPVSSDVANQTHVQKFPFVNFLFLAYLLHSSLICDFFYPARILSSLSQQTRLRRIWTFDIPSQSALRPHDLIRFENIYVTRSCRSDLNLPASNTSIYTAFLRKQLTAFIIIHSFFSTRGLYGNQFFNSWTPKVFCLLEHPRGCIPPTWIFLSLQISFVNIMYEGVLGSMNLTVTMTKFYFHCMTLKMKD